ncbi:MAG: hypothetical protein PHF87_08900 [Desulfotomaculaceae bacterium]|nr:hypothetical protein [Desulfotomaculaceae bacterium]
MNWTRYKLSILLCAVVVAWGVSCSIAEFNYRVRPEDPLYAFKLEDHGHGSYHVDFLGESISFALLPDWVRQFADSEQIRRCREQAAIILDKANQSIRVFLPEAQIKLNKVKEWLSENKLLMNR